jgi:hypothetical protein
MSRRSRLLKMGGGWLVAPGYVDRRITWARTQGGGAQSTSRAADGITTLFYGAGTPRFNGIPRLAMIEGPATNLLLNSANLATQSVTVSAGAHTLSLRGTGSVALSGAATGTLEGTGAADRVRLTVTASAGSLTLTVTGSVLEAQLETGDAASSWVPTEGATASRGADLPPILLAPNGLTPAGAFYGVVMLPQSAGTAGQTIFQVNGAGDANRYGILNGASGNNIVAQRVTTGSGITLSGLGTMTPGQPFACALAWNATAGVFKALFRGGSIQSGAGGPGTVGTGRFGHQAAGGSNLRGEIAFASLEIGYPSDAEFQARLESLPAIP